MAAQNGHLKAVEVLIGAEAQVDIQDKVSFTACLLVIIGCVQNGTTALHIASQQGHCRVVGVLLEAKADVHLKTNNVSHTQCMVVFV